MTQEEKNDIIVVIIVGTRYSPLVNIISTDFQTQIEEGWLQIVQPTVQFRNLLEKKILRQRDTNFTRGFRRHIVELNMKFIFLMEYCAKMSKFYLQLNDQTETTMRFLPVIKKEISLRNISQWFGIKFSKINWVSLGRLYQSRFINQITEMGALFYSVILPFDIISSFLYYRMSNNVLIESNENPFRLLKIKRGDPKPNAVVKTSMSFVNPPEQAYSDDTGYFWAQNPQPGQYFEIVFKEPITLTALRIDTGTQFYQDFIYNAVLEACLISESSSTCEKRDYRHLAEFRDPFLELSNLQDTLKGQIKTLRISFLKKMQTWLVIRDVALWQAK